MYLRLVCSRSLSGCGGRRSLVSRSDQGILSTLEHASCLPRKFGTVLGIHEGIAFLEETDRQVSISAPGIVAFRMSIDFFCWIVDGPDGGRTSRAHIRG